MFPPDFSHSIKKNDYQKKEKNRHEFFKKIKLSPSRFLVQAPTRKKPPSRSRAQFHSLVQFLPARSTREMPLNE